MKVYIDLVLLINFYFDFLLLMTTSLTLKRNTSIKKITLGALLGSISILFLFISLPNILFFFIKIILAFFMLLITFGYKNLKYALSNLSYFYMISIILGGFLYYLNLEFSYTHIGLLFINNKININLVFFLILSPVVLFLYYKQTKKFKSTYSLIYKVTIVLKNKNKIEVNGYLDTGNKLVDPITNKPIILINKNIIKDLDTPFYYVPYHGINHHNLLKCMKPLYVEIEKKKYKNYLLGLSDKKFQIEGVECLLNHKLMEEIKE